MAVKKRQRVVTDPLERANAKSDEDFVSEYLQSSSPHTLPWRTVWTHPRTGEKYQLSCLRSSSVRDADMEACFRLIEETSRHDYENSYKWQPRKKQKEMKLKDLRYILVKDASGAVRGFTSLMPTFEEGEPVVYCYEIHLKPELQRTGLGSLLLGFHITVAFNLPPITKVMLTCFVSNARALGFYQRFGFVKDYMSPEERILRGKTYTPDYTILSRLIRDPVAMGTTDG